MEEIIQQVVNKLIADRRKILDDFISTFIYAQDCDNEELLPMLKRMVLHEKPYKLGEEAFTKFWITFDHQEID